MNVLYDTHGRRISLGEPAGHGGEATVYHVTDQPNMLAKVYEPEPRVSYAGKLAWMVTHPPENPTAALEHASLAWPEGLLFDARRRLKGYWMPYIQRAVPLLEVFNPRRRAEVLPQFDRRYLLRTARNLAAALSALQRSGYVAGDLNESNVLVTPTALITLIDTDSFQVREERDGKLLVHPCPVGKPEYTPPELQGHALAEIIRQPDHDAFGLGVLIFQLLMEGSHPFRAQWLAAGDPPPLEVRIANGAYPYMKKPAYPVLPPKNALGIETLHPWLVELFDRCFVDGHRDPRWRPGAELWVRALSEAEHAQVCCAEGHYYSSHLRECPYCAQRHKRIAQGPAPAKPGVKPAYGRAYRAPSFTRQPPAQPARPAQAAAKPVGPAPVSAGTASAAASHSGGLFGGSGLFGNFPRSNSGGASIFGAPLNSSGGPLPGTGVLRARPPITPGILKNWVRVRMVKSITVGGGQGALVGALPGAVIGIASWSNDSMLAWSLAFSLGGAAGGLLRGWKPGHKLASVISRTIGWKFFWEVMGLLIGASIGGVLGMFFVWAVIPVILGLILGAQGGLFLGRKIFQLGDKFGWERIWGVFSAVGFGVMGFGLSKLIGALGANTIGSNLATGLFPFAANESAWWAFVWLMAGAAGGALAGALAGVLTDMLGRLTGLMD